MSARARVAATVHHRHVFDTTRTARRSSQVRPRVLSHLVPRLLLKHITNEMEHWVWSEIRTDVTQSASRRKSETPEI